MTTTAPRRRHGAPDRVRVRARTARLTDLELRTDDLPDGVCGIITGIALVYSVTDAYGTQFAPGALERTKREKVAAGKVQLFLDHEYGVRMHVGVVKTLTTAGDAEVLTAWLFDTEDGRKAKDYADKVIRAGGRTGFSVGFYNRTEPYEAGRVTEESDAWYRYVEIELDEVSMTPRPAVPGAALTGVRREAAPDVFRPALAAIRDALGADEFTALVAALSDDDAPEGDPARHTAGSEDSADAGASPDSRDAETAETPARPVATMADRVAAVRQSYRRS